MGSTSTLLTLTFLTCHCTGPGGSMPSRFSPVWPCDPMDWGPSDSSVHGILQARILEWVFLCYYLGLISLGLLSPPFCRWATSFPNDNRPLTFGADILRKYGFITNPKEEVWFIKIKIWFIRISFCWHIFFLSEVQRQIENEVKEKLQSRTFHHDWLWLILSQKHFQTPKPYCALPNAKL